MSDNTKELKPNQCREAFEELKNLCEAILLHDDGSLSETNKFWRRQGYETVLQFIKTKEVMPNTRPEPTEGDKSLALKERFNQAIVLLYTHGLITDGERRKARTRLNNKE